MNDQAHSNQGTIAVSSAAFEEGQPIPQQHTAEGEDVSPPLSLSNLPPNTKQLAIVMDDPDAPSETAWVHWVIYNLSGDVSAIPQNVPKQETVDQPIRAAQGRNSFKQGSSIGYRGPP